MGGNPNGLPVLHGKRDCCKRNRNQGLKQPELIESDLGDYGASDSRVAWHQRANRPRAAANIFTRSDRYNFVRHGIAAVARGVRGAPGSPEQKY